MRRNKINKVKINDGVWLNSREEIVSEFCNHLKCKMTFVGPRDLGLVKNLISPAISQYENTKLVQSLQIKKQKMLCLI